MVSAGLRLLCHVILSPRRLLIAALVTTFLYAAVVAAKARLSPESGLMPDRAAPTGGQLHSAPRNGRHRVARPQWERGE